MSTILLVDDELEMIELFTEVLELMDHRVLCARDGLEALCIAREAAPDLVVTDWMMPRMNGLELCHQLHADEHLRHIPIILHSSSDNPRAPGVEFVPKSCALDEFERLVERLLASAHAQRKAARRACAGSRAPPSAPPARRPRAAHRNDLECEVACSTAL